MPEAAERIAIARPPEDVFAFIAEVENNPRWNGGILETRWVDPGPTAVGRRAVERGRGLGREVRYEIEVVEWDPPRVVVFRTVVGLRIWIRTRVSVNPDADGGQSVVAVTVTKPQILGRRIDGLISRATLAPSQARLRRDLVRLRDALEDDAEGVTS